MPEKSTNADKQIGSYSLLWVILFWVIVANYSQDEADADGLKYYWNYAYVKLIASGVVFIAMIILGCVGAGAVINDNENCAIISGVGIGIVFLVYIIIDLVYMYTIIYHNKEITKAHLITDDHTYPVMLQVVCIICMIADFIFTALLGCITIGLPFFIKDMLKECGCNCCCVNTVSEPDVDLPGGNTKMVANPDPIVTSPQVPSQTASQVHENGDNNV
tara:strand:+ start:140 stop:793 length:654 start_codon:yes stop_codon:yes gene_type:complete